MAMQLSTALHLLHTGRERKHALSDRACWTFKVARAPEDSAKVSEGEETGVLVVLVMSSG